MAGILMKLPSVLCEQPGTGTRSLRRRDRRRTCRNTDAVPEFVVPEVPLGIMPASMALGFPAVFRLPPGLTHPLGFEVPLSSDLCHSRSVQADMERSEPDVLPCSGCTEQVRQPDRAALFQALATSLAIDLQHRAIGMQRSFKSWDEASCAGSDGTASVDTTASGQGSESSATAGDGDAGSDIDKIKTNARQIRIESPVGVDFCGGGLRIDWPVDVRKLRTNDQKIVSSSFDLFPGVPCKLMLKAATLETKKKGPRGFMGSKGWGYVNLKCEAGVAEKVPPITFRMSIASSSGRSQPPRGPVTHDFADSSVCGLLPHDQAWNFHSAVEGNSQTFTVRLEVQPRFEVEPRK